MHDPWPAVTGSAHVLSPDALLEAFAVRREVGLSDAEAARRLVEAGENALSEAPPRSALAVLLAQFRSVFTVVLMIAAIVAGVTGDLRDALIILTVVVLNALLGFYQEYRAEHSLLALRRMLPRTARVRRNDRIHEIPAHVVVPGDILMVEAGDRVAADARILLASGLQVDESGLTGESAPVAKDEMATLTVDRL